MTEVKINIIPLLLTILGSVVAGFILWAFKDLITTLREFKKEINALRTELTVFRTTFDLFKERTDSIPGLKENLVEAHKRITDLDNKTDGRLKLLEGDS